MFSLTEVPPQSEKELWLASLTEAPLNPKKNFGSLRSPKSPSIRRRTLARFAHRSYFFFGATCYTMTTDYSLSKKNFGSLRSPKSPLNPKKNFGSLRSPKLFLLRSNLLYHDNRLLSRKRTLARFAHRSYFFFGATTITI